MEKELIATLKAVTAEVERNGVTQEARTLIDSASRYVATLTAMKEQREALTAQNSGTTQQAQGN